MGEQRKIVAEHFPVEKLPEELRAGLADARHVTVTVEVEEPPQQRSLLSFWGAGKGVYDSPEAAVDAIRKLRDEWP